MAIFPEKYLLFWSSFVCTLFFLLLLVKASSADVHHRLAPCPCSDPQWCKPVQKINKKEVFVFANRNDSSHWMKYDWSKVTTLVLFGFMDHELVCFAHKHGARAVTLGNFPVANLTNEEQRKSWVKNMVSYIQDNYLDGVNFDIESSIAASDRERVAALTALVAKTSQVLKQLNPYYQVTFDVAWSPANIAGRCYDILGLSKVTDFLFVMSYDEQSQTKGPCIAMANSGFNQTAFGLQQYLTLGVKPYQLVLGLPWYGYDYECISLTKDNVCFRKNVPFRGVPCSVAAGHQRNFGDLIRYVDSSVTGRRWDEKSLSPYFVYKDASTGKLHQVWYDDPISLRIKYNYAVKLGLRGVGMWNSDSLDYSETADAINGRIAVWSTIPSYGKL